MSGALPSNSVKSHHFNQLFQRKMQMEFRDTTTGRVGTLKIATLHLYPKMQEGSRLTKIKEKLFLTI